MNKSILVNNGNLGRMGKTTLSYTIYKTTNTHFKYITNDLENASIRLEKHIPKEDLFHFPEGRKIELHPTNMIFDFGGKPDERLLQVANYVDIIIVPIAYQSISELQLTIKNINALKEQNTNIVVVINNTDNSDAKLVTMTLNATFPDIPVFTINHSKFIRRLANNNQTVFEVAKASKGDGKQLAKKILPQFNSLFNYIGLPIGDTTNEKI